MEKMSFLDYLEKFKPGEPIKDVKGWIDALVNYHAASIVAELRTTGDKSVLRLKRIGNMLEDCIHYLFTHDSEVCESYLIDEIRPWLTQYSQKHPEDDVLFLYTAIEDEDGEYDYLKDHFPWMYGDDTEAASSFYTINGYKDDDEDDAIPDPSQENEYSQEQEEEIARLNAEYYAEYYEWYDSLTEEELLKLGYPIGEEMVNPLKDEFARRRVKDALVIINNKVLDAKKVIKDFIESREPSSTGQSLADYAEAIAPIINGEVFNKPIDGCLLEDVLSAKGRCGLIIKKDKESRWIRIIWTIFKEGPKECQNKKWLDDITKVWGLENGINKRPYDSPKKRPDKVLAQVEEAISNLHT